jgi:demethylmenaquinone methyltransferase/2-methoxy-6-polyprenyl-1,4-benzoquinol methylase
MFDRTAADYDRVERALALGTGPWYRRRALRLAGLRPGMRVLDVGVGTGLVASAAASIVGDPALVTGLDPSIGMLRCARVPEGVSLTLGRAEAIPLHDASVDFLSMGFALRHLSDLSTVFSEFFRVLRPGALLCILEITAPASTWPRAFLKAYLRGVVPVVARVLARHRDTPALMRYYWDTIEACVPPQSVLQSLSAAGFIAVRRDVELGVFSAYCARKP